MKYSYYFPQSSAIGKAIPVIVAAIVGISVSTLPEWLHLSPLKLH